MPAFRKIVFHGLVGPSKKLDYPKKNCFTVVVQPFAIVIVHKRFLMRGNTMKDARSNTNSLGSFAVDWNVSRRDFLKVSAGSLAGLTLGPICSCKNGAWLSGSTCRQTARFGIVTDVHYADRDTSGSRYYRDSTAKLTECVDLMNTQELDFIIELGDFKDLGQGSSCESQTLSFMAHIEKIFQRFNGPTYHVLGNHDMDCLSKAQFLATVENTGIGSDRRYYSFDINGLHFVVLDANYFFDGTDYIEYDHNNSNYQNTWIPPAQLDWLRQDLKAAGGPAIVFIHQLLDGKDLVHVNNSADVRQVLQASGKVLASFQGHHHTGDYHQIEGIHYYTLKAMVEGAGPESNSYDVVEVHRDCSITVTGYCKAVSKQLAAPTTACV